MSLNYCDIRFMRTKKSLWAITFVFILVFEELIKTCMKWKQLRIHDSIHNNLWLKFSGVFLLVCSLFWFILKTHAKNLLILWPAQSALWIRIVSMISKGISRINNINAEKHIVHIYASTQTHDKHYFWVNCFYAKPKHSTNILKMHFCVRRKIWLNCSNPVNCANR